MKCANCAKEAMYEYKLTQTSSILYCHKCLPKFLEPLKKAGNLTITAAMQQHKEEALQALAPSSSKKKAKEPEPAPVEEPVEESINEGNS